jgi:hypothetical protein
LWKNKEQILSHYEQKDEKCGFDDVDKALLERFKVQRDADFPINGPILKIQAEKYAV